MEVYYKLGKEKSFEYEDAQDGYDYNKGRFSCKTFTLNGKEKELIILEHKEGSFETQYKTIIINLKGLPFNVKSIEIDKEKVNFESISFVEDCLQIDKDFTELHIFA